MSERKIAFLTQTRTNYYEGGSVNPTADKAFRKFRDNTFGGLPHYGAGIVISEAKSMGYEAEVHDLFDERLDKILEEHPNNILFISTIDLGRDQTREIIRKHPQYAGRTVVGGQGVVENDPYFENLPIAVVVGRSEGVVSRLLENFEQEGVVAGVYKEKDDFTLANAKNEPYLNPEFSQMKQLFKGSRLKCIELSTGCTQDCKMCPIAGEAVTHKPVDTAINELQMMNVRSNDILVVSDHNLFNLRRRDLVEFFTYLNERNINWAGEGTIYQVYQDEELMKILSKGCYSFLSGLEKIESGFEGSTIKEKLAANFAEVNQSIKKSGLPVTWSMTFPFDDQTKDTYFEAADFILAHEISTNLHLLQPRVGSDLFEQVSSESRLLDDDSRKRDGAHLVYEPKLMSVNEAMAGFIWLRGKTGSLRNIMGRMGNNLKDMTPRQVLNLAALDLFTGNLGALRMRMDNKELIKEIKQYETEWKTRK